MASIFIFFDVFCTMAESIFSHEILGVKYYVKRISDILVPIVTLHEQAVVSVLFLLLFLIQNDFLNDPLISSLQGAFNSLFR